MAGARVTRASAPTAAGLSVASRMSHPLATIWSHEPRVGHEAREPDVPEIAIAQDLRDRAHPASIAG